MDSKNMTRRGFVLKLGALVGVVAAGGLVAPGAFSSSKKVNLTGAKLAGSEDKLIFSLTLDGAITYKTFILDRPDRVIIDLKDTHLSGALKQGSHERPPVRSIRYAERDDGRLRVVLDLSEPVSVNTDIQAGSGQSILSVTLRPTAKGAAAKKQPAVPPPKPSKKTERVGKSVTSQPAHGKFVVIIDPGHGGRDPGATGRNGTREKDVVLEVARKLQARINRERGMRAILTRNSDTFIPLRTRMDIAHQHKADLFISVHADANPNSSVTGSSVYILSQNGASSEAAHLLAESENAYEVKFGGVSLRQTKANVASVLLDLSQNAMLDRSLDLAKVVLSELTKVGDTLRKQVESAGFIVLKSPDIPSMLVETAFISNPAEEKRLRTAHYQQRLADAMFKGVKRYQVACAEDSARRMA